MSTIIEIFSYPFMVRAIIVGSLVSLCAALLGVSLVLKRYSMIGDGLSHVGFGALSVAAAMNVAPLKIAIPVVIIAAFFLLRISSNSKIQGDAAIALISSSSIAAGVIVTSMTSGLNADVYSYMFGSILAYNMIIAVLTAVTIVVGMRIMGTMLISSLVIFPTLTSMRLFKSFKSVVISSAIISIICFTIGIIVSYIMNFPAGASIVAVNLVAFIVFVIIGKIRG